MADSIAQCNSNSSAIRKKKIVMSVKVLENDTLNSSSFDSLFKEIINNEKLSEAMRKKKVDMSVKVTVYRLDSTVRFMSFGHRVK